MTMIKFNSVNLCIMTKTCCDYDPYFKQIQNTSLSAAPDRGCTYSLGIRYQVPGDLLHIKLNSLSCGYFMPVSILDPVVLAVRIVQFDVE